MGKFDIKGYLEKVDTCRKCNDKFSKCPQKVGLVSSLAWNIAWEMVRLEILENEKEKQEYHRIIDKTLDNLLKVILRAMALVRKYNIKQGG